jgi:hypothetical protein
VIGATANVRFLLTSFVSIFNLLPECFRGLTKHPNKRPAHVFGIAKAGAGGYLGNRLAAVFDQVAGGVEAKVLNRLKRGHAGFRGKDPAKMLWVQSRMAGQSRRRKPFVQALRCPSEHRRGAELWWLTRPVVLHHGRRRDVDDLRLALAPAESDFTQLEATRDLIPQPIDLAGQRL